MKILIGGSPCTHWSIAQTKNRETEASGIGWELFLNYRIARDKYQPDFFLYENNKSMSPAIREQITEELGVEPVLINSALVSAQNRQRLYWAGKRNKDGTYSQVAVEQPVDRGILLRDILESGVCWKEKGYALLSTTGGTTVGGTVTGHQRNGAAEPVRIGEIESAAAETRFDTSKQYKVYSPDGKATALCGNGGGAGAKNRALCRTCAGTCKRNRGRESPMPAGYLLQRRDPQPGGKYWQRKRVGPLTKIRRSPARSKSLTKTMRRNCWKWPRITWHKKKSHLRPVLSTRRRWQYRRRKTVRYTYIISGSRTEYKPEKATGPRPRIAPVRVISKVTSSRKGGTHGLRS